MAMLLDVLQGYGNQLSAIGAAAVFIFGVY
jgi:hypothetical protein